MKGEAGVRLTIGSDGRVRSVVATSGALPEGADDALRTWRFLPVLQHGVAVEFVTTVKLRDGSIDVGDRNDLDRHIREFEESLRRVKEDLERHPPRR
jgi:hypothetical protein